MNFVLSCALCLAVFPSWANAAGVSDQMFPALRKRLQQKVSAAQLPKAPVADDAETQEAPAAAPGVVPAPLDANADGFPELPAVSSMLSQASGTLKSVNSQTSSLEARVVQAQMQSEAKMAKQKAAFEEKLKSQEQGNQAVITANDKISAEIKELKANNAALRKHAHEIGENNKLMRSELKTLEARLGVAEDFTGKSLTNTDDSKSALLQVLRGGRRGHKSSFVETTSKTKRDEDDDDEDDDESDDSGDKDKDEDQDDDDDEGSTSFLAISSKKSRASRKSSQDTSYEAAITEMEATMPESAVQVVGPAMPDAPADAPGDLLQELSKQVAALANQEKESEKNLKNLFIRDFRAGAKRHQALLAQQKSRIATRGNLQGLKAKLETAVAHLEETQSQLQGRLHGLGQYLQKLAHFAMAPQNEVPHLLEVLPKTVAVKEPKAN